MRKCMEEVDVLLKAGVTCIWITTYEEEEVVNDIRELVAERHKTIPLYMWSVAEGVKRLATMPTEKEGQPDMNTRQPMAMLEMVAKKSGLRGEAGNRNIFILRDLQEFLEGQSSAAIRRYIRDIKEYHAPAANILICVSPHVELPDDISKLFRIVNYGLPEREDVEAIVNSAKHKLDTIIMKVGKDYKAPTDEDVEGAVNACMGMTKKEIAMALSESIVRSKSIDVPFLLENKIQEVKKTGILDYKVPEVTLDDVGGNRAIKKWLYEQKEMFAPAAREFGLEMPKGFVGVGVPGCAKTLLAEAFAGMMNIPMLSLSMAKIMSKHVGESERKIEMALQVAKSCAPCVLLLDEVEKLLGSAGAGGSSNRTDGGVTNRVFASLLKFMNDNDSGVYVIMTSNDISSLPPEFTRMGRVDGIWYFGLPGKAEREEILRIHFAKFNKELPQNIMDKAVADTNGYTGAELKEVVKNCMRKAFIRSKSNPGKQTGFTEEDITASIQEVIPISQSSKEKIMALDNWCEGRARRTDYVEHEEETEQKEPLFGGMFKL